MDKLRNILKETILPNTPFEIDYEWSGIMVILSIKISDLFKSFKIFINFNIHINH